MARTTKFRGGENDTFILNKSGNDLYGEAGADTFNLNVSNDGYVTSGGTGNDTFNINASNAGGISGGDGDDIFVAAAGTTNNLVNGGAGVNTLQNNGANIYTISIQGIPDSLPTSGTLIFEKNQQITEIAIGDKKYTIKNKDTSSTQTLTYSYNQTTGVIDFKGDYFDITCTENKEYKINLSGNDNNIYGNSKNDTINILKGSGNSIYGNDGDDTITMNSSNNHIYGNSGKDTITLNAQNSAIYTVDAGDGYDNLIINADNNTNVTGGNNNDTITINGKNNVINGGDGDDLFINKGSNNTVNGEAGTNILNEGGTNTTRNDIAEVNITNTTGTIKASASETITLNVDGKTYSVKNNSAAAANFGYNLKNGILTLSCTNFEVTSSASQNDNIVLNGSNNIINCVGGANSVTVQTGSNNTINGGDNADNITINSANNIVYGNAGDDNITIGGSNNNVYGNAGADTIIMNGVNNNIHGDAGNDKITVNKTNGAGYTIDGGENNDTITVTSNNNTISGGAGDDTFINKGANNTYQGQAGYNTLREDGKNSTLNLINKVIPTNLNGSITIEANSQIDLAFETNGKSFNLENNEGAAKTIGYNVSGSEIRFFADNVTIQTLTNDAYTLAIEGDNNTVTTGAGDDIIKIKGDNNTINAGDGDDTLLCEGNVNKLNAGAGDDTTTLASGDSNNIDGGVGKDILIKNATNTTYTNINEKQEIAEPITLQVGANGGENSKIDIELGFMIPFIDFNITSAENAISTLNDIDELMDIIHSKMTSIGTYQNRLESAFQSNLTAIENFEASKSMIMDADIAEESAEYTRTTILQNATSSLLAQTGRLQAQSVMEIIYGINNLRG